MTICSAARTSLTVLYLLRGGGGREEQGLMLATDLCNSEMRKSREFYQKRRS